MVNPDPLPDYTTPLSAALSYAQRGWPVLPLHTISDEGHCTCKKPHCRTPGKHPIGSLAPNGKDNATTDQEVIRGWWRSRPAANVGIATGAQSGLVVLDVDPRKGGDDTLMDLEVQHGRLPDTVEAITGGGGRHILFRHPGGYVQGGSDKLGAGLDVKADGGYIVADPSLHLMGRYCWDGQYHPDDTAIASLPGWLLSLLVSPIARHSPNGNAPKVEGIAYRIPDGRRSDTLTSLGGTIRRRGLSEDAIAAALLVANREQCDPPLEESEVKAIAASVTRYEPDAIPYSIIKEGRIHIPEFPVPNGSGTVNGTENVADQGTSVSSSVIKLWELPEPGPRRWVVSGLVPEEAITILYGDGGQGKSFLALYLSTLVCLGWQFANCHVEKRNVLYIDAELDVKELGRRAYDIARGLGLSVPPIGLHYHKLTGSLNDGNALVDVHKAIYESGAGLCVLDSLTIGFYGGEAKEARDVTALMKHIEAWGTVIAIDHIRNPEPGANVSGYRPFGSVFKYNQARSVIQLVKAPGGAIVLRPSKGNFGALSDPVNLAMEFAPGKVTFTPIEVGDDRLAGIDSHLPAKERVYHELAMHKEGAKPEDLEESLGMKKGTIRNHLTTLKQDGKAEQMGNGLWRVITIAHGIPDSQSLNDQEPGM